MMEHRSGFGTPNGEPLLRVLRQLADQKNEEGLARVLVEAAKVVGAGRMALSSVSPELEWGAREVRVPIPETAQQLVATYSEMPSSLVVECLHAIASTVSVVLRLIARDREAERTRFHVTLGRGVAGVVHDIANPLNALQLSLEAARDGIDVADALADALGASRMIRSALDRLRRFNGVVDARPSVVDVGDAIAVALRISSFATRGLAEVVVRVSPGLSVWARSGELEHVLVNVLINAAQAISGLGGFHHRITVAASRRGSDVVLEVRDTGPGIAAGQVDRLFDEGFTTKASRNGSGLGLSLCRDIVTKLGGSIAIESTPGRGTAVTIGLPAARLSAADDASATEDPDRDSRSRDVALSLPRVLVVDADELVARAVGRAIHRIAVVTTANSMDSALAVVSEGFDWVICEHRPPQIDGLAIREQALRASKRGDRTVLMIVDSDAGLPAGTRVITKPLDIRALTALVQSRY